MDLQVRKPPPSGSRRQHDDPVSISAVLAGFLSALLTRIRRLVPKSNARHCDELARAIAKFLKDSPSAESELGNKRAAHTLR
ncbi:hypothetical protein ABID59_001293 [Bradyrhizobium sp. S3.3.6]|uniref:hypothetical protein n=1 Tax=Bradyrhizobium sp. S3.3.6 TaxID=3156429 RepID=UPI0033916EC5